MSRRRARGSGGRSSPPLPDRRQLIGNAIKFTEKGEVVLSVELHSRTEKEVCLHFVVRDTGIGSPSISSKSSSKRSLRQTRHHTQVRRNGMLASRSTRATDGWRDLAG